MFVVGWVLAHDLFDGLIVFFSEFEGSLFLVVFSVSVIDVGGEPTVFSCDNNLGRSGQQLISQSILRGRN